MYPSGIPGISARRVPVGGGVSLRVIESGPSDAAPVVLVHGWGASVYSFAETIPALAAAGYRVVAIDRGLSAVTGDPFAGPLRVASLGVLTEELLVRAVRAARGQAGP